MYNYQAERAKVFTEDGSVMYAAIRDHAKQLLNKAGAFTMGSAIRAATSGDTFVMQACVDRLVELGEILEVTHGMVAGQNRVFVANYS